MKTNHLIILVLAFGFNFSNAQELDFKWDYSVNYGSLGQRTVVINDTLLYHVSGRFYLATPFEEGNSFSFIESKSISNPFWVVEPVQILRRMYINAHAFNSKIYITSGSWCNGFCAEMEIYDLLDQSVIYATQCPEPKSQAASAIYDGNIYIFGGTVWNFETEASYYSNTLNIYDIENDTWSTGDTIPIKMVIHDAVVHNGKIYSIGGYDGITYDEVFAYDIASNSWAQVGTSPIPVSTNSLAVYDDFILSIGTYEDEDLIMRYDILNNSWITYESDFFGRRHASTVVFDNKIFVIAGVARYDDAYQYFKCSQSINLDQVALSTDMKSDYKSNRSRLKQNYPNPFKPETTIRYTVYKPGKVQIKIYSISGQLVRKLVDTNKIFGEYEVTWDGKSDNGNKLRSGSYFYQLITNGVKQTKQAILLR